jgi:hypothetical protein
MSIPPLNEHGVLPPGVYPATLEEIDERFGRESEIRQAQMQSLRWLTDLARQCGVRRIVVNGSFVSNAMEPNDVDCVLLAPSAFPYGTPAAEDLLNGLPFLAIEFVGERVFDWMVNRFFATDRLRRPKGMVEILL